jgi:hypothetical protein
VRLVEAAIASPKSQHSFPVSQQDHGTPRGLNETATHLHLSIPAVMSHKRFAVVSSTTDGAGCSGANLFLAAASNASLVFLIGSTALRIRASNPAGILRGMGVPP